ncbi:MAG: universal stress protein [Bacteroidota bacterium]
MKKILVPCDFSEPSIEAFRFAIDIASLSGGSVTVLKVIDMPVGYDTAFGMPRYIDSSGILLELGKEAKDNYEKLVKKYGKGYAHIKFYVVHGSTSVMIRDYIEEKKFSLVVMGTHGATGMNEFFVGSNAEKIVRFSKVPVFVIRKNVSVSSIRNIVFPTSMQVGQGDFIKELKLLQEFFNAKLHILFLNTPENFIRDNELKEYAAHYKFTNFTLNLRQDRYEPDGIISFVEEIKADMLAMATHGRKGLSHFLAGSITEDVVNHIECPVWTYTLKKKK